MKLFFFSLLVFFALSASAQTAPAWKGAKSDITIAGTGNSALFTRNIAGSAKDKALWGYLSQKKTFYSPLNYGDYKLNEYDTSGNLIASATISGKLSLISVQADTDRNTMTFGGFALHKSRLIYSYMVARLDSTGAVAWVRQSSDTTTGDVAVGDVEHAAVSPDSSVTVFATARGNLNWGGGITTSSPSYGQAVCVHYAADGTLKWIKPVGGFLSAAQQIRADEADVWVTGTGRDSTKYMFDAIATPANITYTPFAARLFTGSRKTHQPVISTGVTGTADDFNLAVMPNPASSTLTISGFKTADESIQATLSDITGRVVARATLVADNARMELPVAQYPEGMYVLRVQHAAGASKAFRVVLK